MAQKLGNVPVGTILHMKENGVYQDYLVVHQGLPSSMYDASCNGTWLLRKATYSTGVMTSGISLSWEETPEYRFLTSDFIEFFEQNILDLVNEAKITANSGTSVCKFFHLSASELNISGQLSTTINSKLYTVSVPTEGSKLSYFSGNNTRKADKKYNSRTVFNSSYADLRYVQIAILTTGAATIIDTSDGASCVRPAMIMQFDTIVDDDNNILAATYPTPPTSITVPTSSIPTGSTISVSWSTVSGAESYQLQRSVDGGAWETIYTGTQTSYSDTAGVWNSVKYQVATIKVGIVSGYTTSTAVTILPYTIDKLTVPSQIMEGQSIPISWTAAPAATTYILERKVNSGSWTQIYSGANKSYTDTPSGGWSTVQYRVKGGANGQYGTYKTSPSIPVISASALVISGTDGYLGTLTADIGYTVSSDTGNPISVERYVNGQLVATVTVQSGFSYTIPVMDLPTGAGTVKISASVNTAGGQVSATRTWTYDKRVVLFPEDGGPAQIQVEGKNLMPPTLAECVRVPTVWGGTMDKALELLLPLLSTAVMATGSYTGTGTFGSSSPNTLTFGFTPELVILSGGDVGLTISNTSPSGGTSDAYIQGTTAKWYSTSAAKQLNVQGKSYSYVAIGKAVQT